MRRNPPIRHIKIGVVRTEPAIAYDKLVALPVDVLVPAASANDDPRGHLHKGALASQKPAKHPIRFSLFDCVEVSHGLLKPRQPAHGRGRSDVSSGVFSTRKKNKTPPTAHAQHPYP